MSPVHAVASRVTPTIAPPAHPEGREVAPSFLIILLRALSAWSA
jgi:hypothetical protein